MQLKAHRLSISEPHVSLSLPSAYKFLSFVLPLLPPLTLIYIIHAQL